MPGPTLPLYLAGARMLTNYPTSIVVHGMALNITVQTYDKSLDFGLMACGQAMPETAELAAYIETAFMEFLALPVADDIEPAAQPKPKPKPARKRAAPKR
ncbi:WS/DGAT domain-containing protein [Roseateles sp.]|uniref:WS/DGAT domain-containing protein n=1 Tax=Roseateles sp. TaxID=1971397 RepID=UPI00286B7DE7|nr:WS/DGAT domain-containing protein [Roseateles sp.]